jgi:hypothetical protein
MQGRPTLICHGTGDDNVHFEQSVMLINELIRLGNGDFGPLAKEGGGRSLQGVAPLHPVVHTSCATSSGESQAKRAECWEMTPSTMATMRLEFSRTALHNTGVASQAL